MERYTQQQQRLRNNAGEGAIPPSSPSASTLSGTGTNRSAPSSITTGCVSASTTTLTAISSSDYPHTPSDSPRPRTPSSRPWSSQPSHEAPPEDHPSPPSDDVRRTIWGRSESDDSSDDEAFNSTTYVPPRSGSSIGSSLKKQGTSRSKGGKSGKSFFHSILSKFTKSSKRFGYVSQSQQEQDRNVLQHQIIMDLFDGRYHLAPVIKPRAVLDVGTGPALWALEYGQRNPQSSVLGIDVEKIRPHSPPPPNYQFHLMDVTKEWDLGGRKFDFIHVRMLGDVTDKRHLIRNMYDHLNPGGWVEITEWISLLHSPNHSLEGTAFHKWNLLLRQGVRNLDQSLHYPTQYKSLLERNGFERVVVTKLAAPTNACYPGKKAQRIGHMMTANWNAIIEPLSIPIFTIGLGWPEPDVHALIKEARTDIGDTQYHSYMTLFTVYARRPRSGGSSTTSLSNSSLSTATQVISGSTAH
ncbi:hypothetical protein ACRALDRAFT_1082349 [Sodiomyces alcalophilus JCM 7366]|uniref:uncharacterized protein n=1 Tax=Sodiomyces alcalophilus JCM 7366 TaxID=591952 RepID=UPI0039B48DAB